MAARLVFRIHAVQRMSERGITERDVREILSAGLLRTAEEVSRAGVEVDVREYAGL
jgi:hypothetical protein